MVSSKEGDGMAVPAVHSIKFYTFDLCEEKFDTSDKLRIMLKQVTSERVKHVPGVRHADQF